MVSQVTDGQSSNSSVQPQFSQVTVQYSHNSVKSHFIVHFVWQAQYLVRLEGDFS